MLSRTRFSFALLLPLASLAQAPSQNAIPPQLRQAATLIADYGNTKRYAAENATVKPPAAGEQRVVFMGDSITDNMHNAQKFGAFFPGKPYLNRGISGQTTAQMLLRFYPDVIALQPKAVVIFGGTNDIAGNLGPVSMESIENNIAAMADMARGDGIKVILAAVMPVCDLPGKPPMTPGRPPESIVTLNRWIKEFAASHNAIYLDYYSATMDEKGMLRPELTEDGLHPVAKGYEIMNPLAEKAIAQARYCQSHVFICLAVSSLRENCSEPAGSGCYRSNVRRDTPGPNWLRFFKLRFLMHESKQINLRYSCRPCIMVPENLPR
jgi:lysophospholipase L1-like esterase